METRICLLENLRWKLPTGEGVRPKKKPIPFVRTGAPIYIVAILDYLATEVLEFVGNASRANKKFEPFLDKCYCMGGMMRKSPLLMESFGGSRMKTIKDQVAGSDTTNVESSQHGRGREEQRDPMIPKPRGKFKDLTASFESRLN
ncbi:hypothetical protein M9H77_29766 [Catharanthus roseus]|uniref:Uncharacterized protein n=1 Tax=Catharanthus roseus TaxID=4058 RepID=A0ACB9ZW50_CATRO|nr:hypothetical protein M9H77_29766 [Catharanthus roseus]